MQQEAEIRAYAARHQLVIAHVFKDAAKSGSSTDTREDFLRMIELSETEKPAGLLVWNFARFARDQNDSMYYKAKLRKRGIVIHSLTDPIPADDFAARIVETVLDLANEEKRLQNSRDVKRGLVALVEKGFAPGTPPRGYMRVSESNGTTRDGKPRTASKWHIDPQYKDLVAQAFAMRAQHKSYREIHEAVGKYMFKSLNCYRTFFKNKAYIGTYVHSGKEYPDHHPPIVTQEIFNAAQYTVYPSRKGDPFNARRVDRPSLLSGFTYCLHCGAMMIHNRGSRVNGWRHYFCGTKDRQGRHACIAKRVGGERAEAAILRTITEQVLTVEYLEQALERTRAEFGDGAGIEKQIKQEQAKIERIEIKIERVLRTIENTGSAKAYARHIELEQERATLTDKVHYLKTQLQAAQVEITPEAAELIIHTWRKQLEQNRAANDINLLKRTLLHFVAKVELGYNSARVHYTYPFYSIATSPDDLSHSTPAELWGHLFIRASAFVEITWSKR